MNKEYFDEIRMKRGMTLEKLSEDTGIPVGTLSKISSGSTRPSYHNMCLIARALNCSLDDFTDVIDSALSEDEQSLLEIYRKLGNHSKEIVRKIIDMEAEISSIRSHNEKYLMECFVPTKISGDGAFYESCNVDIIDVGNHEIAENGDFCIKMVTDALCPVYFRNDILVINYRFPMIGETAIFLHNHRQYIRKYYRTEKGIKLMAINDYVKSIDLPDLREYVCVGTVMTVLRGNIDVITPNKYKKIIGEKKLF